MPMNTVGLIYNVKGNDTSDPDAYLEWDEPSTVAAVKKSLSQNAKVISIEANSSLFKNLSKYKGKIDILFNIAEGSRGTWREAMLPIIAEEIGIPYVGSDPATMILCLDKRRTKEILNFHKIKTPSFKVFDEVPELTDNDILPLEFPMIVKPICEGSSKGIKNSSLVMNKNNCQHEIARIIQSYKQPALVEEFISGREFTVGVLGNSDEAYVLPIVELNFSVLPKGKAPIYSYEAKWVWDVPEKPLKMFTCPADLKPAMEKKIKELAIKAFNALGCRDWCRIDIRLDKQEKPYVLELNPIPGILPDPRNNSCLPKAAFANGWDYDTLINIVLGIACKRYLIKHEYKRKTRTCHIS